MAKEAGEIVRYEPAPEPMVGAVAIALLTFLNLVFILLFANGIINWSTCVSTAPCTAELARQVAAEQQFETFCLASALTTTAFILAIYRRWFLPDLLVVKKRRNKFEDL